MDIFDPTMFATYWVNHTSRVLMRRMEVVLKPFGFGVAQLPILRVLFDSPKTQKELLELIPMTQPSMTELLGRMERDGIVRREMHPTDRRSFVFQLTEECCERLPELNRVMLEEHHRIIKGIPTAHLEQLKLTLETIRERAEL